METAGLGAAALSWAAPAKAGEPKIQGFEEEKAGPEPAEPWKPVSDRKIRMGIVGFGVCRFGSQFSLQHHPNVQVVAVSDLFPDRCQALAQECQCEKTYPSLEEMVKDDSIEAIFVATDAPSHCRHCLEVLQHGKHVATAVPAVWGRLEDADRLFETVKKSGLNYMMFETSCFHAELYAMRQIYAAGGFGKLVYSEGEYFHYACAVIPSYKDWRIGLPPQWYPTHSNAYYVGVTGGSFTEVSCLGMPSIRDELKPENNRYQNPFGTEIALFRTERRRHVADGRQLGHAGLRRRGRPRSRPEGLDGRHGVPGTGEGVAEPGQAAAAARRPGAADTAARTATWATSSSCRSWRTASRWSTSPGP